MDWVRGGPMVICLVEIKKQERINIAEWRVSQLRYEDCAYEFTYRVDRGVSVGKGQGLFAAVIHPRPVSTAGVM